MNEPPSPLSFIAVSDEQRPALELSHRAMVMTAGAGAGKTRSLVARYLALLEKGFPPRRIAAITFTRKAAREMRNRVREAIDRYVREMPAGSAKAAHWEQLLTGLDAARIGTIHELCAQILRTHPAEAGIDPRFAMLEEGSAAWLRSEVVVDSLAWAVEQPELHILFSSVGAAGLHEMLSELLLKGGVASSTATADERLALWEQRLAEARRQAAEAFLQEPEVASLRAELEEIAPADPGDRMALQRALALNAFDAARTATDRWQALSALGEINLVGGSQKAWPGGAEDKRQVSALLKELRERWRDGPGRLPAACHNADRLLAELQQPLERLVAHAVALYRTRKHEREALDFDDLEELALALLTEHAHVRAFWQQQLDALLVDEYQDTNDRQRQIVNALCGDHGNLFIVGDGKQSIYRFRGAEVEVFRQEQERIRAAGGAAHELTVSYRPHAGLLQALNAFLPGVMESGSPAEPWRVPFAPLRHFREAPDHGLSGPYVELELAPGKKDDALPRAAAACAARIAALVAGQPGLRYQHIAILCRSSASFAFYEDALEKQGIPYQTISGRGFYDRPEIRDLLNSLEAIVDPADDLALFGFLRSPVIGFDDVALYRLRSRQLSEEIPTLWSALEQESSPEAQRAIALLAGLRQAAGRLDTATLLQRYLEESDYLAALHKAGEARAARNVAKLLADAQESGLVQVHDYLSYVRDVARQMRASEARATVEDAVQIMSIHQAKGLEFPVVVVGDINHQGGRGGRDLLVDLALGVLFNPGDGDEPAILKLAKEQEKRQEQAESDRLFYVAATRARDKLLLNGHVNVTAQGRPRPDGWLRQLFPTLGLDGEEAWEPAATSTARLETRLPAVACTVYGDAYIPPPPQPVAAEQRPPDAAGRQPLLVEPLPGPQWREAIRQPFVWRVVPAVERPTAPARVVGTLVHEAISAWRFPAGPGDAAFAGWARARAHTLGVGDEERLDDAARQVSRLLLRLRQHPLYDRLNRARRLPELPFAYYEGDRLVDGTIDLLYEDDEGWHLLDFKTDRINDPAHIPQLALYEEQVRGYARAVQRLAGIAPRCTICWLNYRRAVVEHPVTLSPESSGERHDSLPVA